MGITARVLMTSLVLAACADDGGGDGASTSGTAGTGSTTNAADAGPGPNTSVDDGGDDTPTAGNDGDTTAADSNDSQGETADDADTTAADSADSDSTADDSTGTTGTPLGDCDGIPVVASGVGAVYMEAELIDATADWTEESDAAYPGFTGSYFQWNDTFGSAPGEGETALQYCFAVETEGTYWLETHGRRDQDVGTFCETSENDGCNDIWVQIDGQGSGDQTWTKKMQSGPFGQWQWDDRWDPQNGSPFRTEIELSAGVHLLGIAGRSHRVKLDAIRIFLAETDPPTR